MLTRLRAIRLAAGLTQEEVAKKIGVSRQWFALIDAGRLRPTREMAEKIAAVFGISPAEILEPLEINMKVGEQ